MFKNSQFLPAFSLLVLLVSLPLAAGPKSITIGTLDFPQQQVLSQILGTYLEKEGFQVSYKADLNSISRWRAMEDKEVDIAWEDPAMVWFLKYFEVKTLPDEELYEEVRKLDREEELVWLGQSNLKKRYTLTMEQGRAEELGILQISDLAGYAKDSPGKIKVAMEDEFFIRPDCYTSLKEIYGLSLPRSRITTGFLGIGFGLLARGQIDVVIALSTEPLIRAWDLLQLVDDKEALPPYLVGLVAREQIVDSYPELPGLIEDLLKISPDASEVASLNLRVYNGESPVDIALEYLEGKSQEGGDVY